MIASVISVHGLGKRFRIGKPPQADKRRSIIQRIASPFEYLVSSLRDPSADEIIWALRDVSFEIQRGEVVGIIGRNGAGKSTLLKILSRIIEPTTGNAVVYGRVGSLLEVGTGFHPELTGRENIYLYGAILGMKKAEIDCKFDPMVSFAEVRRFIDTPVKRYSSGMYVRLAFSVAAHLEPEILLIDEVLAVGDLAFQQKCLERIRRLTMSGMTVLLVSHSMAAIQSSCDRVIYLEDGQVAAVGKPGIVIDRYRQALQQRGQVDFILDETEGVSGSEVTITGFELMSEDGRTSREIRFGESARIRICLYASRRIERPMINFGIMRGDGVVICNFNNWYDNFVIDYIEGDCCLEGWLPPMRLVPDFYQVHVLVWPWGGGHQTGGLEGSRPHAWVTFGDFHVTGPALNSHDGIFQIPARKWRFFRSGSAVESRDIHEKSIYDALGEKDNLESA